MKFAKCLIDVKPHLTKYVYYIITDETDHEYQILNNLNNKYYYPKQIFMKQDRKSGFTGIDPNEVIPSVLEYTNKVEEFKTNHEVVKNNEITTLDTPKHYDNSKGTLYKIAQERGWNPYLFDIVKRLERAEKKGEFDTDLDKSINVIKLWKSERNA